jgi:hypothetical protein
MLTCSKSCLFRKSVTAFPQSLGANRDSTLNYAVTTSIRILHNSLFTAWPLKMVLIGCPETSMNNYQPTLRKDPKMRRPHLHPAIQPYITQGTDSVVN